MAPYNAVMIRLLIDGAAIFSRGLKTKETKIIIRKGGAIILLDFLFVGHHLFVSADIIDSFDLGDLISHTKVTVID